MRCSEYQRRRKKVKLNIPFYPPEYDRVNTIIVRRNSAKLIDIVQLDGSGVGEFVKAYPTTPWLFRRGDEVSIKVGNNEPVKIQ